MASLPRNLRRTCRLLALFSFGDAVLLAAAADRVAASALSPFETAAPAEARGPLDRIVFERLRELRIQSARPCSDAVFLRRVHLDTIGTLPTAAETRAFLADTRADKRRVLIEDLLRRDEFADYWAMKWSDLLRLKAEFPINLWPNAAQAYHRWIRTALRDNLPYDRFAREILTSSGSNFRVGPVNFFRALPAREPRAVARAVALNFMGTRAERWPAAQLDGLAAFFARIGYKPTGEWKEEIVFFDANAAAAPGLGVPLFPDGSQPAVTADADPRMALTEWLTRPENPWFTRAIANRVWSWLLGRGIVHEPDDLRLDNPPANPALLDFLAHELVAAHFDLRHLFRLILNSQTYQLSSISRSEDPRAEANFAFYALRRLEAEVLIDAINGITGESDDYASAIPEPLTFVPEGVRAIALPDGSISSSFLEAFGRPARDTGLESERSNAFTPGQRLHLLNSTHIQRKLERGRKLQPLLRSREPPGQIVPRLYLAILSRYPTAREREVATSRFTARPDDPRAAALDLAWALINTTEFLYRH